MSIITTNAKSINPDPIDLEGFPTFAEVNAAMSMEGQRRDHNLWAYLNQAWDTIAWGSTCYEGVQERRQQAYEAAAKEMARLVPPAPPACCDASEAAPCRSCVEASPEPETDPSTWDASADAFTWELSGEPTEADRIESAEMFAEMEARDFLDASERLTLLELTERQRDFFAAWGNACGSMFADLMGELMARIELTQATSPAELDARLDVIQNGERDDLYRAGFAAAISECRSRGAMASSFGHDA